MKKNSFDLSVKGGSSAVKMHVSGLYYKKEIKE